MKKRCEEENRAFKKELTEFGCSYDLHGAGFKQRQEEAKRKIELLQDELLLLRTGIYSLMMASQAIPSFLINTHL